MRILAVDCAHGDCSAAYVDNRQVVSELVEEMERGQAERLIPMVCEVLKAANADFGDVDVVAVTTGPGSFTGVRVGLAAADGIALAAGLPMVGVSVLDVLAAKVFKEHKEISKLCLVLETKRDDYYVQCFKNGVAEGEPAAKTGEEIKALNDGYVFAGNGVSRLIEEIGTLTVCDCAMPTAGEVALVAADCQPQKEFPAPMYLREAEVTICSK